MKWDAVFFDLDNTLFNYEKTFELTSCSVFNELKTKYGWKVDTNFWFRIFKKYCDSLWDSYEKKKLTREEYKEKRFQSSLKELDLVAPKGSSILLQKRFDEKVAHFVVPSKGLHELLKFLYEQKVTIGIISNGGTDVQMSKIESLRISHWIPKNNIFISELIGLEKPDPSLFQWVVQQSGSIHHPLYIGDSIQLDIVPALKAGWSAGFLGSEIQLNSKVSPTFVCANLEEIYSVMINTN